jgi:hypothetical protein
MAYAEHFNIMVVPCVSPWGYETIQRWTSNAIDPNRSFHPDEKGPVDESRAFFNPEDATDESALLVAHLQRMGRPQQWLCHIDLHETTDTDDTEFRPATAARDGVLDPPPESIPDGFYLVSDSTQPQGDWHSAMIESVKTVTHIAPPDPDGTLIGEKMTQEGVIVIPAFRSLGLCAGVTDAPYLTTTEVYPDSPTATDEQCNLAQIACIEGALNYLQNNNIRV